MADQPQEMERGACGCTNHNNQPKVKWPSQMHAITEAAKRSRGGGTWEVYPCPVKAGAWHVSEKGRSKRPENANRKQRRRR